MRRGRAKKREKNLFRVGERTLSDRGEGHLKEKTQETNRKKNRRTAPLKRVSGRERGRHPTKTNKEAKKSEHFGM